MQKYGGQVFNIFTFTKDITNFSKLDRELKAHADFGSLYNFCSVKGNELTIHFTQNLVQTQMDSLSSFVSAFSNVSVRDTLENHLRSNIDPFVSQLMTQIRAENIELGITQMNKTSEVLGFFEEAHIMPGKTRSVSLQSTLDTGSLTVTIGLLTYLISNSQLYSDLSPFVTPQRLTDWRNKIIAKLS